MKSAFSMRGKVWKNDWRKMLKVWVDLPSASTNHRTGMPERAAPAWSAANSSGCRPS